jgi:hypothetical protein
MRGEFAERYDLRDPAGHIESPATAHGASAAGAAGIHGDVQRPDQLPNSADTRMIPSCPTAVNEKVSSPQKVFSSMGLEKEKRCLDTVNYLN